jgi:hypothetical protein
LASEELEDILEGERAEELGRLTAVKFFRKLSGLISGRAIIFEPKPRSYFRTIDIVERELRSVSVDWAKVKRAIRSCRGTEFLALMKKLNDLRASSQMREFHTIIGGLLRVRKKAYVADQIENPEVPGEIVHDPLIVASLISSKYRQLFSSDDDRPAFEVGRSDQPGGNRDGSQDG